jgi:hypothetical protein
MNKKSKAKLRRQAWWEYPAHPDLTSLYLQRFLNYRFDSRRAAIRPAHGRKSLMKSPLVLISIKGD